MVEEEIENGGVAEWLNAAVLKTASGLTVARRFESSRLRHYPFIPSTFVA